MPEIEIEVKTYEVNYMCDRCAAGNMKATGDVLMSNPPQFRHRCPTCGHEETHRCRYPKVITRPVSTERGSEA